MLSVGALVLTGCASNTEGAGGPTATIASATKAAALADLLPAAIKTSGVLRVGIDPTYAPNEYKLGNTIVGFDVDLINAVAQKLGLSVKFTESTFDNIIPGITGATPKYDIGVASFTDNKEREKQVDFVTYYSAGSQWAAKAGSKIDPDNACGLKVAVQTGTVQDNDDVPARSKTCQKAGKKALVVQRYDKQDDATTAVALGKADALIADSPVTSYGVKQSKGKLALVGKIYDAAPYGYPMKKGTGLPAAIQKAVQALIDDGTYDKICKKWLLSAGEIKTSQLNGAIS